MIKLLFSGDFAPLVSPQNIKSDHFSELQPILEGCDLHITNLECPLTLAQNPITKSGPSIKANPQNIELLKQASVSVACLANNHIFDYNEMGITDTLNICKENRIDTLGIVSRADGQPHWLIKEVKGKRIGFLNYCEHEFSVRDEGLLGAKGYDAINAFYDMQQLRPQVDYLIMVYHGGNEYYPLPNPQVKKDFHYLVDLGADAVIGHHTHVYSGYEVYKGKPLVYSLGNFFFPYPNEPKERHQAVICKLVLGQNIEFQLFPIEQCQDNFNVTIQTTEKYNEILKEIEHLSNIIKDDCKLIKQWHSYSVVRGESIAKTFLHSTRAERLIYKNTILRGWMQSLLNTKRRAMVIKNIIRCQSLNVLLTNYLKQKE